MSEASSFKEKKKLYRFNTGVLRDRFLSVTDDVFISFNYSMKQYNLLLYRLRNQRLPLPKLLYSYYIGSSIEHDSTLLDLVRTYIKLPIDDKSSAGYSISNVINENFYFGTSSPQPQSQKVQYFSPTDRKNKDIPNNFKTTQLGTSFVIDYFCTSTFPAVFGHFSSNEYIQIGYKFIKRHIKDQLAPRLVGTFLLHATLFKDRLFTTFLSTIFQFMMPSKDQENPQSQEPQEPPKYFDVRDKDINFKKMNLLEILYNSFAKCINYFTEYHVKAVNLLSENDKEGAAASVTNYFLHEVVSLWKYSPICNFSSIFNKVSTVVNPDNFSDIIIHNIIDDLLVNIMASNTFSRAILELFEKGSLGYLETANIASMKYDGGISCCVTIADLRIIRLIADAEKTDMNPDKLMQASRNVRHSKTVSPGDKQTEFKKDNVYDLIKQMFLIRTAYRQYLPNSVNEPVSKIKSDELCEQKLDENKQYLEFLAGQMRGMKPLQLMSECSFEILRLKERQYASYLWTKIDGGSDRLKQTMLASFSFSIFTGYVNYQQVHIDTLTKIGDKQFYQFFESGFAPLVLHASKKPIVSYIFDLVSNYYKVLLTNEGVAKQNNDIFFSEELVKSAIFLVQEIDRISFELLVRELNETPFSFLKTNYGKIALEPGQKLSEARADDCANYMTGNMMAIKRVPNDYNIIDDTEAQSAIEQNFFIYYVIYSTSLEMKYEIDSFVSEKFRLGDKLLMFLLIKNMIQKSLEKSDFAASGPDYLMYYYLVYLVYLKNIEYFVSNLINCIDVVENLLNSQDHFFPTLGKDVLNDIDFLKTAFNVEIKKRAKK